MPLFFVLGLTYAQSSAIFREKDVSELALIQALTPRTDTGTTTAINRGIRVNSEHASSQTSMSPSKTASASLLLTFRTNSADLTASAMQSLDVVGDALNSKNLNNARFEIQGHADPRGNPAYNLKLSERRAKAVRHYLVQSKRIPDERLDVVGKGDKEVLNLSNPAAPENRRVTIVNLSQ
jgi:outer membrane protein OmpA-like peptidoglycan-associated protein